MRRRFPGARIHARARDFGRVFNGNSLCDRERVETFAIFAQGALHSSDLTGCLSEEKRFVLCQTIIEKG